MISLNIILPALWLVGLLFVIKLPPQYLKYGVVLYVQGTLFVAAQTALAFGVEMTTLGYIRNLGIAGFFGFIAGEIWNLFGNHQDDAAADYMRKALQWPAIVLGLLVGLPLAEGRSTLAGTCTVLSGLAVVWGMWLFASRHERKAARKANLEAKRVKFENKA